MADAIQSPAQATFWFIQGRALFWIINLLGSALLRLYCGQTPGAVSAGPARRAIRPAVDPAGQACAVLVRAVEAPSIPHRGNHPYSSFCRLHYSGDSHRLPAWPWEHRIILRPTGGLYGAISDYAATVVFLCMIVAIVRRLRKPARYAVPAKYGKGHIADAIFLLALIAVLMLADSVFEGSHAASLGRQHLPVSLRCPVAAVDVSACAYGSPSGGARQYLPRRLPDTRIDLLLSCSATGRLEFSSTWRRPYSLVFCAKLDRGTIKPVRWGVPDAQLDQVKSFGVKTFEDFTWKHMLDFYSCADCGRCSDQCPANAVGRPLSPRFLTTKARDYAFQHYPIWGKAGSAQNGQPLIGGIYSEDEIWSCTTCGACEAECPLLVEYIDKIVDLRRGMVDDGKVPQSLQKPLKALESRGNPFGKMEKKKADWVKAKDFQQICNVRILNGDRGAEHIVLRR